jgi:hypothetical protein
MSIWINDRPLSALVTAITGLDGYLAPDAPARELVALSNSAAIVGSTVTVSPRTITVTVDIVTESLLDRQTMLDALARETRGRLVLRTADRPDREISVVCQGTGLTFYDQPLAVSAASLMLTFVAPDPVWMDREPLVLGLSSTRVPCPLGTATVAPALTLYGGTVVNPVVIVRAASGEEVGRLTLTGSLVSTGALVIDAAAQTLEHVVAGVRQTGATVGLAWLTSGTFPLLDPSDADAAQSAWPTIELSASSGTPTGVLTYARRYS